jgi:hypothetical protein
MSRPIYTDQDVEYPGLELPAEPYIVEAEAELAGRQVTWPQVVALAWRLAEADDG